MPIPVTRRSALRVSMLAAPALAQAFARPARADDAQARLADLEARRGGRLGVAVLDLATGRRLAHRGDERFALCSTFKLLAVGLVLARVDRGEERLDRRIRFAETDLVTHSPAS